MKKFLKIFPGDNLVNVDDGGVLFGFALLNSKLINELPLDEPFLAGGTVIPFPFSFVRFETLAAFLVIIGSGVPVVKFVALPPNFI